MEHNPILTIAIPTYNRIEQVKRQVKMIIPQLTSEVRLVVIDNHSDIPVVNSFTSEELATMTVVRNNANRGILGNWLACFDNCDTPWLWSMSDDDLLVENVVDVVLGLIKINKESVFINIGTERKTVAVGLSNYCAELGKRSSYSDSFWMTKCVFNFEKLKSVHYLNYFYATTMISPVVMILKYMESTPDAKVTLDDTPIIIGYELVNTWLKSDLIKFSILTFDIMDLRLHPFLRKTLFQSQFRLNFVIMNELIEKKKMTKNDVFYSLRLMSVRFGILRMLVVFPKELMVVFIKLIFPNYLVNTLRKFR